MREVVDIDRPARHIVLELLGLFLPPVGLPSSENETFSILGLNSIFVVVTHVELQAWCMNNLLIWGVIGISWIFRICNVRLYVSSTSRNREHTVNCNVLSPVILCVVLGTFFLVIRMFYWARAFPWSGVGPGCTSMSQGSLVHWPVRRRSILHFAPMSLSVPGYVRCACLSVIL